MYPIKKSITMGENTEKLGIILSHGEGQFAPEEAIEIAEAFSKIEPVELGAYIRESAEVLPQLLIIALSFVGGAVASGFFGSIGTDAYNKAKDAVKKAFKSKPNLNISFEMKTDETEINIWSQAKDEKTIDKIFDTIDKAKEVFTC